MLELGPGLTLGGAITLAKKLGEGGMGSVWVADHLALRTQVAVKFLSPHMAQDASAAARFQREATAAARIKSPHIVQIFDHGMSQDFGPYIVMELLDGETVSAYVTRHGQLTPRITAEIVGQLCKALAKAHALGIVHRDIKPDNVFLIDSQREIFVKVLDFGIAKNQNDELHVTSTGTMMGTPHYMSPEQMLSSKHVDFRADLWAVAVLTYHCLTGSMPFDGETFGAIAIAVSQGTFAPPHQKLGVGSPALDAWFVRALARNPNDRFASTSEFSDALLAAVAALPAPDAIVPAGGSLGQSAVQASTGLSLLGSQVRPAPTFAGVTSTMNGSGHRKQLALAAAAVLAALACAGLAATLLFKGQSHGGAELERTAAMSAPLVNALPPVLPSAVASASASPAQTPSATPSASNREPAKAPAPAQAAPAKPKPKPIDGGAAKPERPDRGF